MRLFKAEVFFLVSCFLLVPLTAISFEEEALEDADYFPAHYKCYDTAFNFAAALYWISEEWKKNAPYEIGYPLLYSILIVLPVLPFLCFMIPTKESLQLQLENERQRQRESERKRQEENACEQSQAEDEILSDKDDEEYYVPDLEPANVTPSVTVVGSKSASSIAKRLSTAVVVNKPELSAPRVVMETSSTDKREKGEVTVHEQFPDLTTIDTTDSFDRLKELGARMCPESTLGKACVAVASGVLISYGIYRLFSK